MPLTQAEIDALTAKINEVIADDAAAAVRLPNALAQFAANHPALDLTALQTAIGALGVEHRFWVVSKLQQLAAS